MKDILFLTLIFIFIFTSFEKYNNEEEVILKGIDLNDLFKYKNDTSKAIQYLKEKGLYELIAKIVTYIKTNKSVSFIMDYCISEGYSREACSFIIDLFRNYII